MASFLSGFMKQKSETRRAELQKALIHYQGKIGGQLFGRIPDGNRREFFCLDEHTWVWHEEWTDNAGKRQAVTTRYDVRPQGVLKSQGGQSYQRLGTKEAKNLLAAIEQYHKLVTADLQRMLAA